MPTIRHIATALLVASAVRGLHAQAASKRPSFAASIAVGTIEFHCSDCNSDSRSGPVVTGRVLFPVTRALELGGELGYYWKSEAHGPDETNDTMTNVIALVRWWLPQADGLYLAGGAGYSKFVGEYGTPSQNVSNHDDVNGFAVQGTVGYEHAVASRLSVGLFVGGMRTIGASTSSSAPSSFTLPSVNSTLLQFGVSLAWR